VSQPKECPLHGQEDKLCAGCLDEIMARVMLVVLRAETVDGFVPVETVRQALDREIAKVKT